MILAAHQPYFSPFPGFFYKMICSDVFVLLDEVQFPRGTTWISRNRFKNDQGVLWVTIPVWKKGLGLQRINDVKICHEGRWPRKHLESLRTAYSNAPYLSDHAGFLEDLFSSKFERLIDLNAFVIGHISKHLQIETRVVMLSELEIESRGPALPVEICKKVGASQFLAQAPAAKYLDPGAFQKAGIGLQLFRYPSPVYPQLWGDFIANLSALDLLFNCGPKAREILLSG